MKIKEGFMLRRVAGASVVVAAGEAAKRFSGIMNLNDTAAFLFERLEKETDERALARALQDEYEVSDETALESVRRFIGELKRHELLQ